MEETKTNIKKSFLEKAKKYMGQVTAKLQKQVHIDWDVVYERHNEATYWQVKVLVLLPWIERMNNMNG
jgi:hypothetical protein